MGLARSLLIHPAGKITTIVLLDGCDVLIDFGRNGCLGLIDGWLYPLLYFVSFSVLSDVRMSWCGGAA